MSHSIFHCLIFYTCAIVTSYMYLPWNPGSLQKLSQSIRMGQDARLLQFLHREINHAFLKLKSSFKFCSKFYKHEQT